MKIELPDDEFLTNGQPDKGAPAGVIPDQLPPDLHEIWGNDPTARLLVAAWGEHTFRQSRWHQLATIEHDRQQTLEPARKNYLKNKKQ